MYHSSVSSFGLRRKAEVPPRGKRSRSIRQVYIAEKMRMTVDNHEGIHLYPFVFTAGRM